MQTAESRKLVLGCTMLPQGKAGVLQRDEHGYFLNVPLGGYNVVNKMGFLYDPVTARRQLEPGSALQRQIEKGALYSEWKHPEKTPGMTDVDYVNRIRVVDMNRCCAHIRDVHEVASKDEHGRPIVLLVGSVKPHGPFGKYAEEALLNPHINSFFSVRCLTMDDRLRQIKYTREKITWDMVGEGGILKAQKYASPSLEDFGSKDVEIEITQNLLWKLIDRQKQDAANGVSLEHASLDYESMAKDMGWERRSFNPAAAPKIASW